MSTERLITMVAGAVAAIALFWFVLLSPKLQTEKDLSSQISSLNAGVASAEQASSAGVAQKHRYRKSYASLVRLGKAVPADSDTPSLLTQVSTISNHAGIELDGLTLSSDSSGASVAPAPTTTTTTGAPATETTAALLPLGASVGPAGLSVMPYDVTFAGDYFETAKLLGGLDALVHLRKRNERCPSGRCPSGRLVTINSFSLTTQDSTAGPISNLQGTLSMTTYLAPPDQGLTAGATSTSPVPAGAPAPTTASSPSVAATVTP